MADKNTAELALGPCERTVLRGRLAAQLLTGEPAPSADDVVHRLLAVQAQDQRGARLSVRSRSRGVRAQDVESALGQERSMVITWLNRGTLHLICADDYWWLHPLTAPQQTVANQRRLHQEGVSTAQAEKGVDVITEAVAAGPQSREQIRDHLQRARLPIAGQALPHYLIAASLAGRVVQGPVGGARSQFVPVAGWLGPAPDPLAKPEALARLARRYLAGHAPASPEDLAKWAGITLGDARRGFNMIIDETVPVGEGLRGLAAEGDDGPPPLPPPRLLGPFDPLLHGWASREMFVGRHRTVVTTNGLFRPFALVDGRAVALWSLAGGTVSIRPLELLRPSVVEALRREAGSVLDFLRLPPKPVAFM